MRKNLLDLDLQHFADEVEDAGENEVEESATPQEDETTEDKGTETVEESGNDEPQEQSPEENARYAAIRRRAEEDAKHRIELFKKKNDEYLERTNREIAALCQGVTHPVTGQPISTIEDYISALKYQQKQAVEAELQDKGIDPGMIDRMIATNPVVMQAQQVIQTTQKNEAAAQLQRDIAELGKYDPNIKTIQDLANLPNYPDMVKFVAQTGGKASIVDAYKALNFDSFMQHTNEAARQQAINQMRGKSHLPSQPTGVATENDDVEVPSEIMSRYKAEGKTEKQIRELYRKVAKQLNLN